MLSVLRVELYNLGINKMFILLFLLFIPSFMYLLDYSRFNYSFNYITYIFPTTVKNHNNCTMPVSTSIINTYDIFTLLLVKLETLNLREIALDKITCII